MFIQLTDYRVVRVSSINTVVISEDDTTVVVDGCRVGICHLSSVLDKLQIGAMLGNQLAPLTKLGLWLDLEHKVLDFSEIEGTYLTPEDFKTTKGLIHILLNGELATKYAVDPNAFNMFGIVPELQGNVLFYKEQQ